MDELDPNTLAAAGAALVMGLGALMAVLASNPVRGLYLYIFASGIIVSPSLPVVREKLSAAEPILACTLLALLLYRHRLANTTTALRGDLLGLSVQRAALAAGAAFLAIASASAAVNFLGGRIEDPVRTGLEFATFGLGGVACAAVACTINTWDRWLKCLGAWTAGGLVVTLVGLMSIFVYAPAWTRDEITNRVSSTLRESGQVASYLGPILPFATLAVERTVKRRWVKLPAQAIFLGAFVVMLGTGSRIAAAISIAAFVALIVALLADARRSGKGSLGAAVLVFFGAIGFAVFTYTVFQDREKRYDFRDTSPMMRPVLVVRDFLDGKRHETERFEQTTAPLRTLENHPILGIGPGNFARYYHSHEVHNTYLAVLGETGLLGAGAFAAFLLLCGRCGWAGWKLLRPTDVAPLGVAFLFGCGLLLLYQLTAQGLRQRPLWFCAGLCIAMPRCAADLRLRIRARQERLAAHAAGSRS